MTQRAELMLSSSQIPEQLTDHSSGLPLLSYRLTCGKDGCENKELWHSPSPGMVKPHRVLTHFQRKGWGIGRDRTRDVCPACLMAEREAKKAERPHPQLRLLSNWPLEKSAPKKKALHAHTPASPAAPPPPGMHYRATMTRGFTEGYNATHAAVNYLSRLGIATPKRDRDFRVFKLADGWGWDRINTPEENQEDQPMTLDSNSVELPVAAAPPAVVVEAIHAAPPPQPTNTERREIRDYLDKHYDEDFSRWRGDLSDQRAAEAMDVPRAWITELRVANGLGPDQNEEQARLAAAEAQALKTLDDLEALVLDSMDKADQAQRGIKALRAQLQARAL